MGNSIDAHEPVAFGAIVQTTRNDPADAPGTNYSFAGLIDEVRLINAALTKDGVALLAGLRFTVAPPVAPAK